MWKKIFSSSPPRRGETVQYLIVRQDLSMSPGKMAAQSSHAAVASSLVFFSKNRRICNESTVERFRDAAEQWINSSFAKVVLRVKSREQLVRLFSELDELFIPYSPIFDACRTELEPEEANGSTLTCAGIVPMFRDDVPKCLRRLQVYK